MAANFFSTSNLLLASSFLLTLTSAAPIPRALDVEKDNIMVRTPRDMWSEIAALHPRYSTIDNIRIDESAILPRSPAEAPKVKRSPTQWVEARFDPNEKRKLSRRFSTTNSDGSPPAGWQPQENGGFETSRIRKRETTVETPGAPQDTKSEALPNVVYPRSNAGVLSSPPLPVQNDLITRADLTRANAEPLSKNYPKNAAPGSPQDNQRRSPAPVNVLGQLKKGTGPGSDKRAVISVPISGDLSDPQRITKRTKPSVRSLVSEAKKMNTEGNQKRAAKAAKIASQSTPTNDGPDGPDEVDKRDTSFSRTTESRGRVGGRATGDSLWTRSLKRETLV